MIPFTPGEFLIVALVVVVIVMLAARTTKGK